MTSAGTGDLIENKLTTRMYINISENHVLQLLAANDEQPIQFVQDNSSVHTARIVQEWFEEFPQIERINWPAKSPDLNPIENLWAHTIRDWPTNLNRRDMLRQHVQARWDNITRDYCASLVHSMEQRLNDVIAAGGYYNKY